MAIRCVECGRFIAYADMDPGGRARFFHEPDSHRSRERNEWTCPRCVATEQKEAA